MLRRISILPGLLVALLLMGCNSGRIPCPKPAGDTGAIFAFKGKRDGLLSHSPTGSKELRDKNGLLKRKKYKHIRRRGS